jgi:AraC family transcriptional regulator, regulatory protein of adaptative response / DNA-3-methyladenine glycosylase II
VNAEQESWYRALQRRDARFDGRVVVGVTSTGIYGRPSCPAPTPRREHVRFFGSTAAAQAAGLRACKRCRPEAAPASPEWDRRDDIVARAVRLVADGVVDRLGVSGLAGTLGCTVSGLEHALVDELGADAADLARAQHARTARTLIETTSLPADRIAVAAGFGDVDELNDTVHAVFALAPDEIRRAEAGRESSRPARGAAADRPATRLTLKLAFRRPLSPGNLFGHLAATAVPGVEEVRGDTYRRAVRLPHGRGIAALAACPAHVDCTLTLDDPRDTGAAIARCRWLLDLDADPEGIDGDLAGDNELRPLIVREPGRRIPRTVDGPELAIRAVIGQQISTAAARTAAGRLAARFGEPVEDPDGALTRLFPTPESLVGVPLPGPANRNRSFAALVSALAQGRLSLDPGSDRNDARRALAELPGIGPWTTEIIAMRALGDSDAFPATDLGVRRAAETLGLPAHPRALTARAAQWRPWRAYAVQYLWSVTPHAINRWPPPTASRPTPTRGRARS